MGAVLEGVFLPTTGGEQGSGRSSGTRLLLRWRRWQPPAGRGNTWAALFTWAWLAWLTLTGAAVFSGGTAGLAGSAVALVGVSLIGMWVTRRDKHTLVHFLRKTLEAHIIALDRTEQERVMEQAKHTHETVTHEHAHTHPGGETHEHAHTHQQVQHEHPAGTAPHQHQQPQEAAPDPTHTQAGHPHPHSKTGSDT